MVLTCSESMVVGLRQQPAYSGLCTSLTLQYQYVWTASCCNGSALCCRLVTKMIWRVLYLNNWHVGCAVGMSLQSFLRGDHGRPLCLESTSEEQASWLCQTLQHNPTIFCRLPCKVSTAPCLTCRGINCFPACHCRLVQSVNLLCNLLQVVHDI